MTKLFNALSSTMFGVYVPFMRGIQLVMIVIFVIGFVIKTNSTIRDLALGRHRIWFPFVGQIPFALLCLINNLCFVLILVSFGYHYLVLALIKIGCNYLCLEVGEGHGTLAITLVSLPIWVNLIRYTYKPFLVSVPAFVGLVTESVFGGEYYIYSTGLRAKYPWEVAKIENYFSLKTITIPFAEDFVSSDGGVVQTDGSFNYCADIDRLDNYARTSESTIVIGFTNRVKELLTREIVKRTADEARTQITEIKVAIEALYKERKGQPKLTAHDEEEYGVNFRDFTIADVGYNATTQNVLSSAFNIKKLKDMGTDLKELNQSNIDNVLLVEDKMKKNENVYRFIVEGLKDVHPDVMKTIATAGATIANRYIHQQKRKEKKMATETKKEPVTKSEGDFKKVDLSLSKFAEPPDVSKVVREAQPTIEVVGKIIKVLKKIFIWVGLIVLIIFLATNKPLQEKTLSVFDNVRKGSVSGGVEATLKWWKDPSVYGANPELRSGGPFSAKIIIRNDSVLKFDMYYEARDGSRQKAPSREKKTPLAGSKELGVKDTRRTAGTGI